MGNRSPLDTCRACRHYSAESHCTHERTRDKEGNTSLARLVWFVSYGHNKDDYCAGKFFSAK